MLKVRAAQRGVTLTEVMIAVAIAGILLTMGLPAFQTWVQNAQLRGAAESLASGFRAARAEALQRNTTVQFVFTADAPIAANVTSLTPSTSGPNWVLRYDTDPDPAVTTYAFLQGKAGAEGASNVVTAAGSSTISFTAFGRTTLLAASTIQVTNPTGGACFASGGPMRCLNVVVSVGGQVKLCDPAVTTAGDTRAC